MIYRLRKVLLDCVRTVDEYNHALNEAESMYFQKLKEAEEYVGGKLKKQRCGYGGTDGKYDYIVERVK